MKNISLHSFLIILLFPTVLLSQGWEYTYGNGEIKYAAEAELTAESNVLICGTKEASNLSQQAYIYEIAPNGQLLWEYEDTYHITSPITTSDVLKDASGNYLLAFTYTNFPDENAALQKIDASGNLIWEYDFASSLAQRAEHILETDDGGYLISSTYRIGNQPHGLSMLKLNQAGNLLWETTFNDLIHSISAGGILINSSNEIYVTGSRINLDGEINTMLYKLGAGGNVIWEKEYDYPKNESAIELEELPDGNILIAGTVISGNWDSPLRLMKVDTAGTEIWVKEYPQIGNGPYFGGMAVALDGGIVVSSTIDTYFGADLQMYLLKLSANGDVEWKIEYGGVGDDGNVEILRHENGYYLIGYTATDVYLVKTDAFGTTFSNEFNGRVYFDENTDCVSDTSESGLANWVVSATKGAQQFLTLTDDLGNFSFNLDTGSYVITTTPISEYWEICNDNFTIDLTNFNQTISQDIGAQSIYNCPYLYVSIGTPFLRRCFPNTYNVQYCNLGTQTAEDAYVEVTLDTFMTVLNTSIPIANQIDNTLIFELGDIPFGSCGDFNIEIQLGTSENCESIPIGLSHCVIAHIYPDTLCMIDPLWSGASLEVDGICQEDSITFTITNVGSAAMVAATDYIIIEDDVILSVGTVNLGINESKVITIAANGSTFTLQVDQEANHPGENSPSVSVEHCAADNPQFSFGFVNVFPQNDGDPFIDIDCRENIGSYDPNDKMGFPTGHGNENYILENQMLEYLIRFQNTGTDTAFNVVVIDTLSELLNISSVRPGASSHPYEYNLNPTGVLTFSFDNIHLPDSTVDLAGSNGFVKFKVAQKEDLPLESKIYNSAAIYFDFNAPIITNRTLHTIGKPLINTVNVDEQKDGNKRIKVFPNPSSASVNFFLENSSIKSATFRLFDMQGKLIRQDQFQGSSYTLPNMPMPAGLYFFTIEQDGVSIASGKIMRQ